MQLEQGFVVIRTDAGVVHVHEIALSILDYFRNSHSFAEAVATLGGHRDGERWKLLTATIVALCRCGALVYESEGRASTSPVTGFAGPPIHIRMLNDVARTLAYIRAIRRVVTPDDVVLDLGTGTGVLAIAAAQSGARHVFAIESSRIAETAAAMFSGNDVADRITLIRAWSTSVTLPQRASVMVSELIGVDPFAENVVEFTSDARRRLLTPDARLIPTAMRVRAVPISVPHEYVARTIFQREAAERWRAQYGIDFSPVVAARAAPRPIRLTRDEANSMPAIGQSIDIACVDFHEPHTATFDVATSTDITEPGVLNGLLLFVELDLAPGEALTTEPRIVDAATSWGNLLILLGHPLAVGPGDQVRCLVSRRDGCFTADCDRG